ncbi:MAG TPA: response regulator [Bdellovibrionota bacterium]|nr:response regulator [Bdellovibrionota bacterium]
MSAPRKVAYILDDDATFGLLLSGALKRFGLRCERFSSSDELKNRMASRLPELCVLDLSVEAANSSLTLVRELRKAFPASLPILVTTGSPRPATIAEAIEAGANDFLLKPLEREVLIAKLMRHVRSDELEKAAESFDVAPALDLRVSASIDARVMEVDEFGIRVSGTSLLPKGGVFPLDGSFMAALTGREQPVLMTVSSTEARIADGSYESYLEFSPGDRELLDCVRSWLAKRVA